MCLIFYNRERKITVGNEAKKGPTPKMTASMMIALMRATNCVLTPIPSLRKVGETSITPGYPEKNEFTTLLMP